LTTAALRQLLEARKTAAFVEGRIAAAKAAAVTVELGLFGAGVAKLVA
jgi:hypothetical protein